MDNNDRANTMNPEMLPYEIEEPEKMKSYQNQGSDWNNFFLKEIL